MLTFNQIPPQVAEDVNFTTSAIACFEKQRHQSELMLFTGNTLGKVVVANCGDNPEPTLLQDIYEHLESSLPYASPKDSPLAIGLYVGIRQGQRELVGVQHV